MAWIRIIGGVLLVLIGVTWTLQGLNVLKGSGMSGHGQFVVAGCIVALCGLWLAWGPLRVRLQRA